MGEIWSIEEGYQTAEEGEVRGRGEKAREIWAMIAKHINMQYVRSDCMPFVVLIAVHTEVNWP